MEKQVKLFNRNEERMESWLWIELIGFDQTAADFNVDALLHEMSYKPDGMGLFLYTTDFINQHNGLEREELLQPESCSYAAHPYNVDRKRQAWSNWQLRQLVAELHKRQIKVYVSVMGYSRLFSDTSPFQEGELLKESPEIRFVSRDGQNLHITNVLKRFKDGTYYEDFFTRKLIGVLQDYDFDGIQVADGLSSPVRHLENGDYSDDMVEQFVAETKVELPSEWLRGCDDHPEAFEQRGRWIWRNKRKEWVMFHVQRWNGFYKKLTSAVHGIGREILFNNALTMEPVEALYRYGLDYRAAVEAGADGYIVEEVSAALSITSDNGTIFNPATELEERMKVRYHCSAVAMNLKAYNPDLKYLYMTNVWDTTEQFDIVHHAPTMFQRYIYTNLNLYYQGMNGLERCCNGPWFCLSDGLKRQDWDFIHQAWDTGFAANIRTILGATVIWSDQKLYPELDYYMGTRRWTSNRIMGELTYAGAQLNHIARIESLDVISGAIFVPNFHLLPRQELEQILAYRGGSVILFGQRIEDLPQADMEVVEESDDGSVALLAVYGSGKQKERRAFYKASELQGDKLDLMELEKSEWPHRLASENYSAEFVKSCADTIVEIANCPRIDGGAQHCTIMSMERDDGKLLVWIGNDSFWYASPVIDTGRKIKSVRMLTKYYGYEVTCDDTRFYGYVPPRGMDLAEVEFE